MKNLRANKYDILYFIYILIRNHEHHLKKRINLRRILQVTKFSKNLDELIITLSMFRKNALLNIICVFKLFKQLNNFYREETTQMNKHKIKDNNRLKHNILSFLLSKYIEDTETYYEYFEIFKKMDDISFNLVEISKKSKTFLNAFKNMSFNIVYSLFMILKICGSLHMLLLCYMSCKISIIFFIYDSLFWNAVIDFISCFASQIRLKTILSVLRTLRKIDECYISTYRAFYACNDIYKFGLKSQQIFQHKITNGKLVYLTLLAFLKILKKVFEFFIFIIKAIKYFNELLLLLITFLTFVDKITRKDIVKFDINFAI